jgi:hypothetical protein
MTTNPANPTTPTVPDEMTDALCDVITTASKAQADLERIVATATNWLRGDEAYPFPMTGCSTRDMAEVEIAIARYDALRSVAYKLAR